MGVRFFAAQAWRMGGGRLGGCEIRLPLSSTKAILPEPNKLDAEQLAIGRVGIAQVPATQHPQPVPSHGMFFIGACF